MLWIDVTQKLPPLGHYVEVRGDYVPAGTGYPLSYRRLIPDWSLARGSGVAVSGAAPWPCASDEN